MKIFYNLIVSFFLINSFSPAFALTLNFKDYQKLLNEQEQNQLRFSKKYENASFVATAQFLDVVRADLARGIKYKYFVNFNSDPKIVCFLSNQKTINFVTDLNKGDLINISAKFSPDSFDYKRIILLDCNLSRV